MWARIAIGATTLAVAAAIALAALVDQAPLPPLPKLGLLPEVEFVDQTGASFDSRDLSNGVTIAHLIFTRCPTVCPVVVLKMKTIEEKTRDLGPSLHFASISVDPSYDTPAKLSEFAKRFGVSTKRWSFLHGSEKQTQTVIDALKLGSENRGVDERGIPDIIHGTHFVLLDRDRQIRGYYDSDVPARLAAIQSDAARLVDQPEPLP